MVLELILKPISFARSSGRGKLKPRFGRAGLVVPGRSSSLLVPGTIEDDQIWLWRGRWLDKSEKFETRTGLGRADSGRSTDLPQTTWNEFQNCKILGLFLTKTWIRISACLNREFSFWIGWDKPKIIFKVSKITFRQFLGPFLRPKTIYYGTFPCKI